MIRLRTQPAKLICKRRYSIVLPNPRQSGLSSQPPQEKPKISQFGHAIFNTLTISLTTYFLLITIRTNLEYTEIENDLKAQSQELENEILSVVASKNQDLKQKNTSWLSYLKFW